MQRNNNIDLFQRVILGNAIKLFSSFILSELKVIHILKSYLKHYILIFKLNII